MADGAESVGPSDMSFFIKREVPVCIGKIIIFWLIYI